MRPGDQQSYPFASPSLGNRRRAPGIIEVLTSVNWFIIGGFLAALAICLYACTRPERQLEGLGTFGFVIIGWVFSLTVHEFGHAATAFLNGDRSESTRRYLTANPLLYVHPFLSIVLPLLFVLIGGFGLPGGAVYLQRGLIRDRWRQSAISLAGPAGNLIVLLVLAGLYPVAVHSLGIAAAGAIAFLAFFQISAILLNLIPIPGLDGYGAIEPYLSYQTRQAVDMVRPYAFMLVFLAFLIPGFSNFFFSAVSVVLGLVGIDPFAAGIGYQLFHFWQQP
jgi:Zn-dependent protease